MGGSSGGSSGTTTTTTQPWSGQVPYLNQGFADASNILNGPGPSYYPGSTVAPQSANTLNSYGMVANQVNNNPLQNASSQQVQDTLNGNYLNGNPYMNSEFQAGTQAIDNNYNAMVGGQSSGSEAGGRYGSGMQTFQQNQADQTLGNDLGNLYANTYGANYNTERQNQVNAVNQAGTVQQQGLDNANALGTVGSAQDQYAQNQTNANVDEWNYNQNLPTNKLSNYMQMIQGNYGGTSATTVPTSGSSTFGNILGTGLAGASLLKGGSKSDRRLKWDIVEIGKAHNGLTIYSYKYINDTHPHIGFMADEVRKVHPEAVFEDEKGFLSVNYELASMPVKGSA